MKHYFGNAFNLNVRKREPQQQFFNDKICFILSVKCETWGSHSDDAAIKVIWDFIMCLQLPTFRKQYDTSKRRELFTNRDKHNISKDLNPPSSLFYFALSFQLRPYGCKSIYPNIQKGNNNSEAFKGYKSLQRELCCLFYIYEKYEEH